MFFNPLMHLVDFTITPPGYRLYMLYPVALQVSMMAVDEMYGDLPMMERDRYWDDSNPRPPYTAATLFVLRKPSFQGSTFDMA